MIMFKHGLYVIGRKLADPTAGAAIPPGRPEIYAAERFTAAEHLRDHSFAVPADFDLDAVHRSQIIEEQNDGSVILTFTCVNFAPVVSWVLEWAHTRVSANRPSSSMLSSPISKPPGTDMGTGAHRVARRK